MRKTPKIRYVDMAIYVDSHIFEKDPETIVKVHEYLVMLAYMLAIKKRFFNEEKYYDQYANYLAKIVYMRMTTDRQFLDPSDKKYLTPIKSCLNYMKRVLYARKVAFCFEEFNYTTPIDSGESYIARDYMTERAMASPNDFLKCDIESYLSTISKITKKLIKDGVYGNDPVLVWKLYTSCLISLLRNFTLSNIHKEKLQHLRASVEYDTWLSQIIAEETKDAPIVYDLDKEYLDYVAFILQKVKAEMITEINEFRAEYQYPDEILEDMFAIEANFGTEDN